MYAKFHFMTSPRVKPLGQYIQHAYPGEPMHMVACEALEPVYAEGRVIEPAGTVLHVPERSLYASVRTVGGWRLEWHGKPDLSCVPWCEGPELDLKALRREQRRLRLEARIRNNAPAIIAHTV